MTKDELIARLRDIGAMEDDPERTHPLADEALLDYIAPEADDEVRRAYDAIPKWYA